MSALINLERRVGLRRVHPPTVSGTESARRSAADCRKELADALALYGWGVRGAIGVGALALLFTMVNVQVFGSAGHQPGTSMESTFLWGIAWLLDPMASVGLGVAILFETLLARYGRSEAWLTGVKWFAGVMTWTMNIWPAIDHPHPSGVGAGIVLHSLAPGLVLGLAEAAPRVRRKLTEIITELEREAQVIETRDAVQRAARLSAEDDPPQVQISQGALSSEPVAAAAPAVFQAVVTRPDPAGSGGITAWPADRPAGLTRSDPAPAGWVGVRGQPAPEGPEPIATPRSDDQLAAAVRDMAERNGGKPPSQYQLRQALGVGSGRAARLLAELDTTPAGSLTGDGATTGKDSP